MQIGPRVEVGIAAKARIGVVVLTAEILLEARLTGKGHKAHRPALGAVEEGRLVTLFGKQVGNTRHLVHGSGRQEERLHEHGD